LKQALSDGARVDEDMVGVDLSFDGVPAARWEIEIFFHVLKAGWRVEALKLASMQRMFLFWDDTDPTLDD
jgi:hypothetical protein